MDDASGVVSAALEPQGPQVAWKMARGYKGAFGGAKINSPWGVGRFLSRVPVSGSPTCAGRSRCATSIS